MPQYENWKYAIVNTDMLFVWICVCLAFITGLFCGRKFPIRTIWFLLACSVLSIITGSAIYETTVNAPRRDIKMLNTHSIVPDADYIYSLCICTGLYADEPLYAGILRGVDHSICPFEPDFDNDHNVLLWVRDEKPVAISQEGTVLIVMCKEQPSSVYLTSLNKKDVALIHRIEVRDIKDNPGGFVK